MRLPSFTLMLGGSPCQYGRYWPLCSWAVGAGEYLPRRPIFTLDRHLTSLAEAKFPKRRSSIGVVKVVWLRIQAGGNRAYRARLRGWAQTRTAARIGSQTVRAARRMRREPPRSLAGRVFPCRGKPVRRQKIIIFCPTHPQRPCRTRLRFTLCTTNKTEGCPIMLGDIVDCVEAGGDRPCSAVALKGSNPRSRKHRVANRSRGASHATRNPALPCRARFPLQGKTGS